MECIDYAYLADIEALQRIRAKLHNLCEYSMTERREQLREAIPKQQFTARGNQLNQSTPTTREAHVSDQLHRQYKGCEDNSSVLKV